MSIFNLPTRTLGSAIIFTLFLILASCSDNKNGDSSGENGSQFDQNIPAVEAVQARFGSLPLVERLSGTVKARNQVEIYPELSSLISEVFVENGDFVEKGDPLVKLEDTRFEEQLRQAESGYNINKARLRQAEAALVEVKSQYDRSKSLAGKNLISRQEMESIEARLASAEADLALAQAQLEQAEALLRERENQLSKTVVRAPISGNVGKRNAEVGMQAGTNTPLFTIGDLQNLRIEVVLTENMLNYIEVGQPVEITVPGRNEEPMILEAALSRISPFLNEVSRSTEGEISVRNESGLLTPGMFVPVDILYGDSRQATLIPTSALYTDPVTGDEGIYVATSLGVEMEPAESIDPQNPPPLSEPTDVSFRAVDVIARGRMEVAVAGINSGDWVVTVGQDLLSGGIKRARVRTISWDRIITLQGLQRQDLLRDILENQRRVDSINQSL